MLRDQAKGMGAIGRVAKALAAGEDARQSICEAACEVMDAPVAFLLEPSGRDFSSTAMSGVQVQPVTIQPRGDGSGGGKAFTAKEAYFVADARNHPRWRRRWSRRRPRGRPCSSRSCATARCPAS